MHFTYGSAPATDLNQGDVIQYTADVANALADIYPHFKYSYFIVLTQSCDLVQRDGGECKARYITLAAVRPLKLVLEREVQKYQRGLNEQRLNLCSEDFKAKLLQFAARLLNNNEPDFFYLRRQAGSRLEEDHCAFLQLSVTVKTVFHYQTLLAARVLQLNDAFQHKLGHLVGNLYSRVGTQDWVPDACTKEEFEKLQEQVINANPITWIEKSMYKQIVRRLAGIADPTLLNVAALIEEMKGVKDSKKTKVLDALRKVLEEARIETATTDLVLKRLPNEPGFQAGF